MRVFAKAFIICWAAIYTEMAGAAFEYNGFYMYGGMLDINQDVSFDHNSVIEDTLFNISDSVLITNNGNINAYINMCPNCAAYIRNSGVFNIMNNTSAGRVYQVIVSPDDIVPIGVKGSFDVVAYGQYEISLSALTGVAQYADSLILNNSVLTMDAANIPNVPISLIGEVSIFLPSSDVLESGPILKNVNGDGTVSMFAPDVDKLYAIQSYIVDDNVYGRIVRETDYYKIFKNNTGKFLNALRAVMPDNKLLGAMDTAETMDDINTIMKRNARLNPINLMRPIRVMREYDTMDFSGLDVGGIGVSSFSIQSDKINGYGINAGFTISANDNMSVGVSGYYANGLVADDFDEYEFIAYGGRVRADYDDGRFVAGGDIGATIANFNIGPTIAGNNPRGIMTYIGGRVGYRFNITDPITFTPFVGTTADISYVANEYDFAGAINTGFEINIHDRYIGIGYDYGVRTMIDSTGAIGAMTRIGIDMGSDATTVDITAGIMRDDFTVSFRGGLSIRMAF